MSPPCIKYFLMLQDFENRIDSLKAFDFGLELENIVADNVEKLTPYIREQLAAGKGGDDEPSTIFGRKGYAPLTVQIKETQGQGLGAVTDRITNYMTGAFYESLVIKTEGQVFEAESDVPYFSDIKLYSDPTLLEVNEEHRRDFAETVTIPLISEALKTKTGLSIT